MNQNDADLYDEPTADEDAGVLDMIGMPDDVDLVEVEESLAEIELSLATGDFHERRVLIERELGEPTKRELRNLFDPVSYEDALDKRGHFDEAIREQSVLWLARRQRAIGMYCQNPNCLDRILGSQHGRPRSYCRKRCQEAHAQRKKRNADNPNRGERLVSFDPLPDPRPGYSGRRRFRPKRIPYRGVDSLATPELCERLHSDFVEGSQVRPAERIAEYVNPDWTPKHERALRSLPSLRNLREERGCQLGYIPPVLGRADFP